MQIRLAQLAQHLREPLRPLYVVAGDEPLLIQESLDALRKCARAQGYSERQVFDVERGFDWSQFGQAAASLSLFASRRLLEVNLPSGKPGDDGSKALSRLAESPLPDTVIVVICGALEWASRKSAWYTAVDAACASLYIEAIAPEQLPKWLAGRMTQAGLDAEPEAIALIAELTEGNLLAAQQDIHKLKLLCPGGKVSEEQVRAAVADSARFDAFDLTDKVLNGDAAGAVRSLRRLREEGVELPPLVGAWAWILRQWALAAAAYARSRNAEDACASLRLPTARRAPFVKAVTRAKVSQIHGWLAQAAVIDLQSKSTAGEPAAWEELLTCVLAASGAAR